MDDLVTWLRGVLDAEEDRARYVVRDRYRGGRPDSPWQVRSMDDDTARATLVADGIEYAGGDSDVIEYLARYDPRSVLARVEAEQAIVRAHTPGDIGGGQMACAVCHHEGDEPGLCDTLLWHAYGHRFDAPGWREEWKPEGV